MLAAFTALIQVASCEPLVGGVTSSAGYSVGLMLTGVCVKRVNLERKRIRDYFT